MKTLVESEIKFPYNTEVLVVSGWHQESEIYILRETEKAYLLCYDKKQKRGMQVHTEEFSYWCPKSVWHNERNFFTDEYGYVHFKEPYFLIKSKNH